MLEQRLEEIWQELHAIPEPAFKEIRTASFLAERLRRAGYNVTEQAGISDGQRVTGVVGVLDSGRAGVTAALRSDMDCLMFKQEDGSMCGIHACGHDAHMSMVLAAAEDIAARGIERGRVKIIFQPAEEIGKGALALLQDGVLDDVDYLFGIHLMSREMADSGQVIANVKWTACTLISAVIEGVAAHGSKPHLGISAIDVGAAIVNAVNALHTDPLLCGSVKTTRFIAGSGSLNSICSKAELGFDLRSTSNEEMLQLRKRVMDIIRGTAAVYGAQAKAEIVGTCPASSFNAATAAMAKEAIVEEVGRLGLIDAVATTVGEDFNFYALHKPHLKTGFIGLGCGLTPGLHAPDMTFNHRDMLHGCRILQKLIYKALKD